MTRPLLSPTHSCSSEPSHFHLGGRSGGTLRALGLQAASHRRSSQCLCPMVSLQTLRAETNHLLQRKHRDKDPNQKVLGSKRASSGGARQGGLLITAERHPSLQRWNLYLPSVFWETTTRGSLRAGGGVKSSCFVLPSQVNSRVPHLQKTEDGKTVSYISLTSGNHYIPLGFLWMLWSPDLRHRVICCG